MPGPPVNAKGALFAAGALPVFLYVNHTADFSLYT